MFMMGQRPKRYTREFKANAVRMCQESGRDIAGVARDLGVKYQTLYDWVAAAEKRSRPSRGGPGASAKAELVAANDAVEIGRLRRELEEVKKENDFLKKAAAFFAKRVSD
jgi:transposase